MADELALEFGETLERVQAAAAFTPEQDRLIRDSDSRITTISGSMNQQFWTDEALHSASEWRAIRLAATRVLEAMEWARDAPPSQRSTYVGPDG